ncbi:MAG: LPXTG cell wall anchor domain-containing protein [Candidatus Saccharibacteria bacterium]
MPSGASNWYVDTYYKVNQNVANGTQICNTATIFTSSSPTQSSNQICMTVQVAATPTPTPTPTPKPIPTVTAAPNIPPCEQQLSSEDTQACLTYSKSAANLTQNIDNANGTTANAGDVIQYTLSVTNNDSSTYKNYQFSDQIPYVLDYAAVTDAGGGNVSNNTISWPAEDIAAGQTVTKQFKITVDNPIPQTPTSTSDPAYFNLKMSNTFGNTITINLPGTPVSTVQDTTNTLPNTGPGSSILIGAAVLAIAGFFFYRSRLLVKESRIAVREQAGGM